MLNRVNRVLVTNATAANTGSTMLDIVNGDMLLLDRDFVNAASATSEFFYIAQGIATGKGILSSSIDPKNITSVKREAYSAPTEQIQILGFDGTSGTLPSVTSGKEYRMIVGYKDDQRVTPYKQTRDLYSYKSDNSATSAEVYGSFVKQINDNKNSSVSAVLLTNGSFVALSNNATVVKGSKNVTSVAHGLSAGDLVRIGGTGATAPVYVVKSVTDADNFVLQSTYEGASGTVLAANIGEITGAISFGIKLTGEAITTRNVDLYKKIGFESTVGPVDGTIADFTVGVTTQNLFYGQGYWEQVRDMEFFAQGYLGVSNRTLFPDNLNNPATRAVDGNTYNTYVIEHFDKHPGDMQGQYYAPVSTVVCFVTTGAPSTKEAAFKTALETVLGYTIS